MYYRGMEGQVMYMLRMPSKRGMMHFRSQSRRSIWSGARTTTTTAVCQACVLGYKPFFTTLGALVRLMLLIHTAVAMYSCTLR